MVPTVLRVETCLCYRYLVPMGPELIGGGMGRADGSYFSFAGLIPGLKPGVTR